MSHDAIMAASVSVSVCLSLTNTWALIVDGAALGVRPYLAGWLTVSNAVLGVQLLGLEQMATGVMFVLAALVSAINCALIIYYRMTHAQS